MWGGQFKNYKDFNEYCIDLDLNEVSEEDIMRYTYNGELALEKLEKKRTPNWGSYKKYESQFI
jgi:hypothetical protein